MQMENTVMGGHFNSDKYGMVYCPVCKGSGKLLNGIQGNKAFGNLDELWEILNPNKRGPAKSKESWDAGILKGRKRDEI